MTPKEKFFIGFHSLAGTAMKKRKENLFQLLNHVKDHEAEIDFSLIEPRTPLEEVFKVETLIFFRRVHDLLQVLYSENSILIHKVLKVSSWFINEAFGKISGEELVTKVFPNTSYNTKLKLLQKFSNYLSDEQKSDEFFEAIRKSYGLFLASKILPACSVDVILKSLDENKIEITAHQLLIIIKKHPKITETIFLKLENQNYKQNIDQKYVKVFGYLARNNYALFLKLNEKYKPAIYLGTRSSKKVFLLNKKSIIKSPETQNFLKRNKVICWLKEDRFEYFCNEFPKSFNLFHMNYSGYLNLFNSIPLAKPKQLNLLLRCFKKVYDSDLWDYSALITFELLEMMSPDDRDLWMSYHSKPKEMEDEVWISLMKSKKSVPMLIEKLDATFDLDYRKELITNLVQSCRVNDDVDALFDAFQHIIKRCNNLELILHLTSEIGDIFDLTKFTEKHWNYIVKIIPKYLTNCSNIRCVKELLKGYYCLEHEIPISRNILSKWLKNGEPSRFNWFSPNIQYEKKYLLAVVDIIPTIFSEQKKISEYYLYYLLNLKNYNKKKKSNKISYFENQDAIKYLKLEFAQEYCDYFVEVIMEDCLKSEFQKCLDEGLVNMYFNKKGFSNCQKNLLWVLTTHPQVLANLDASAINNWYKISSGLHIFKYAECFKPAPKFVEEYSNLITKFENKPEELNKNAVNFLSHVLKPEVYFDLLELYYPKELRASCETEKEKSIYVLQKILVHCLRNVISPEGAMKSLMHFCQGDYLKMSHGTMYSISNNLRESKLTDFINILNDRAVSVRKYSIYLVFRLLDKEAIYNFLIKLMKTEKNMSVRKYLFKANLLYFLRNQEDRFYELLKENIEGVDTKDHEVYDMITNNIEKVSSKYFKDFFVFSWDLLENAEILDEGKINERIKLLSSVRKKNIKLLPEKFCTELIIKYLFKSKEYDLFATKMAEFSLNFIIYYGSDDLEKQIRLVIGIIKPYIKSTWYEIEGHLYGRKVVTKFVLKFCKNFLSKDCLDFNVINLFLNIWQQEFELYEIYNEFLCLKFTCIYSQSVNGSFSPKKIGESLGEFCNFLDNTGYPNVNIIGDVFDGYKAYFVSIHDADDENETGLLIAENILKLNDSTSGLVLSMLLLHGLNSNLTLQLREKYETIFKKIMSYKDSNVQIYLHQHILKNT